MAKLLGIVTSSDLEYADFVKMVKSAKSAADILDFFVAHTMFLMKNIMYEEISHEDKEVFCDGRFKLMLRQDVNDMVKLYSV